MENETRPDLRISGAGSAGGGRYYDVIISGAGKVNGDLDCNYLNTSGASEVIGNVKSKTIKINGATKITGDVISDEIEVNGGSTIKGNVDVQKIKIMGGSEIGGNLRGSEIEIKGAVKIKGDCEAEVFKDVGGFTIDGLLNADNIYISLSGDCRVREIGGEKIEVRKGDNIVFMIQKAIKDIFNIKEYLVTDTIEGDDIYLEVTTANVVRGNNVTIGPGCNIELVEYKNQISISNDAKVKEQRKV